MRILVEEYRYDRKRAGDGLSGLDVLIDLDGSIPYVGYYFNPGSGLSNHSSSNDIAFILPKVVMDENDLVFGEYKPEDIIVPPKDGFKDVKKNRFFSEFPIWIYRTINVYRQDGHGDGSIIRMSPHAEVGLNRGQKYDTYLDILLALQDFNRENRDFFFYVLRNMHSGYNKINWTRTIATTDAIVQDETPVYIRPVNKKRQINFDEELIVIFYSILNYMSEAYGFPKGTDLQFDLITGKKFDRYLRNYGKTRLLQIKYKYFSDKALKLWNLCYDFFVMTSDLADRKTRSDYLLTKNFNLVFEAVIDDLIGEKVLPDDMDKRQEDGKIVDHMFVGDSIFSGIERKVYYIGDSKYYKTRYDVRGESVYKQYTYARNAIQWNMDIINRKRLLNDEGEPSVILRDSITEGYNIIPNFFISAFIDPSFDYSDGRLKLQSPANLQDGRPHYWHKRFQFKNRLFDRDTMYLFYYKVNFLFVISLYSKGNVSEKKKWKESVRAQIRSEIQEALYGLYDFYAIMAKPSDAAVDSRDTDAILKSSIDNAEKYIRENFNDLVGKIFAPNADSMDIFLVALDKGEDPNAKAEDRRQAKIEHERIRNDLNKAFFVAKCHLGEDPRVDLEVQKDEHLKSHVYKNEYHEPLALRNFQPYDEIPLFQKVNSPEPQYDLRHKVAQKEGNYAQNNSDGTDEDLDIQ